MTDKTEHKFDIISKDGVTRVTRLEGIPTYEWVNIIFESYADAVEFCDSKLNITNNESVQPGLE